MFKSSTKREIRHFHVVVVQLLQANVQKALCTCKVVVLLNLNLLHFLLFSLPSPSSLLKLPNSQGYFKWRKNCYPLIFVKGAMSRYLVCFWFCFVWFCFVLFFFSLNWIGKLVHVIPLCYLRINLGIETFPCGLFSAIIDDNDRHQIETWKSCANF